MAEDRRVLDSMVMVLEQQTASVEIYADNKDNKKQDNKYTLFRFDPNKATSRELQLLGFEPGIVNRIIKYRNSGGAFYQKSDLLKIYGLSQEKYDKLNGYIDLPVNKNPNLHAGTLKSGLQGKKDVREEKAREIFDINKADTLQLKKIKGIGPVLSERIIKYRNLLGGFISDRQYNEVYGLDDDVVARLISASYIEKNFEPVKINLNTATEIDLLRHPYISSDLANIIMAYQEQHGPFKSVKDIKKIKPVDDEIFEKIKAYIAVKD